MQVDDFIPNYPSLDDPELQQKLMNKTEYSLVKSDNTSDVQPPYFDFQVNIARILSPYTPYKKCLLFLDVGVGKCVHPDTAVKLSDKLSIGIKSLYDRYSETIIDENWSLPNKDIFVASYSENGFVYKKISKFYKERSPKFLIRVIYGSKVLIKTQGHKLFTKKGWVSNVKSGDYVLNENGEWIEIKVDEIESTTEYVYDLEIEDTHTYIADGFVTHNTCAAILVHEIAKLYYKGGFRQTIVMAKGPSLLDSYKTKFLDVCPGVRKEMDLRYVEPIEIKRTINQNFIFRTVGAFTSEISRMKDDEIIQDYDNRIIILDESHVLKNYKSDSYKQYKRFFGLLKHSTIIFMTGTPNTNDPWEAASQINLLKNTEDQIELGKKFMKKYYSGYEIQNIDELLKYYSGYIIHLKQSIDLPPRTYVEKGEQFLNLYKLYNVEMGEFQSKIYTKSLKDVQKTFVKDKNAEGGKFKIKELKFKIVKDKDGKDTKVPIEYTSDEGGAFLRLPLESSLMVYPDGTYGGEGYKKNVLKNKKIDMSKELISELRKNLGKYSSLYKEMMDIIEKNPTRVIYIYFDNLNNSGLRLFAKLLEVLKGYRHTKGGSSMEPAKRFGVIDGSMKEKEINQILNSVGAENNHDASRIHVLLGSKVTQTGLTINNATICMVVNPQFTPSSIDQITHRINRPGSLDNLIKNNLPTSTEIYLFSMYVKDKPDESVYTQVYEIAEEKSLKIKPQETLMKRAGLFCPLNYSRNVRSASENYVCYTAVPSSKKGIYKYKRQEDTSTDYLYFHEPEILELQDKIINDIAKYKIVNIKKYKDEPMLLYRACKSIASQKIILEKDGYKSLIFNKGDLFFMDPTISGDPSSIFYFQTNLFELRTPLKELINDKLLNKDEDLYKKLLKSTDAEKSLKIFNKLSKITQNIIFEEAFIKKHPIISTFKPTYIVGNETYNIVWAEPFAKDSNYSSTTISIEDPSRLRILKEHGWAWVPAKTETESGYEDIIPKIKNVRQKKEIEGELYATRSKTDDKFKVYVGKGKAGGRVCHELSTTVLLSLFKKLDLLKTYKKEIEKFKKLHKKIEDSLKTLLKVTKYKAIPADFTETERIGAYFVLQLTNKEKCEILEKEFKKQKLFHVLD